MTDATATAVLSGDPAGGQVVTGGTADGATGTAAPPPAATSNWWDSITDAEARGYIQSKGWKDAGELGNSYRNLEKLLGGEKIPVPKSETDTTAWDTVYRALGRPDNPDGYKLPVPEGDAGEFAKAAASKFHELGISQKQAAALGEWWNSTQTGKMTEAQQQSAQKAEADLAAIRTEWGMAFDENIDLGRRAAREFGLDNAKLAAIEAGLGTGEMLKLMSRLGRGLTEHTFEGGKSTGSFGMTPEAAKAKITALQQDPTFSSKYLNGGVDERAEMDRLMQLAFPS